MRENRIAPPLTEALAQPPTEPVNPIYPVPTPVFDAKTERQADVLKTLQEGTEAILTSDGFTGYLRMLGRFHRYSFNNTILIMAQRPDATLVNSYKRWQGLGRQVRKGETGIKIFVPHKRKVEDPETGEESHRLTGFGIGSVFDVGQTEGDDLPDPPRVSESTESSDVARAVNLRLSRWLIGEGLRLESTPLHGHAQGLYKPSETPKTIVVRRHVDVDEDTGEEYAWIDPLNTQKTKTLAHEAAHYVADHRGGIDRKDAETVAESSAFVVMSRFGLDTGAYSFAYVAQWALDKEVLRRNLAEIQQVSSKLIGAIEGIAEPLGEDEA